MVQASPISDLFSFGSPAKIKVVCAAQTVPSGAFLDQLRSLNIEHVSSTGLMQLEISRHTALGSRAQRSLRSGTPLEESDQLALYRRWFWARKPDAGFFLTDFPATLLQALVFDEWLEARDESLQGVLVAPGTVSAVVEHYYAQGLVIETSEFSSV